jgi:hypothetical protein
MLGLGSLAVSPPAFCRFLPLKLLAPFDRWQTACELEWREPLRLDKPFTQP